MKRVARWSEHRERERERERASHVAQLPLASCVSTLFFQGLLIALTLPDFSLSLSLCMCLCLSLCPSLSRVSFIACRKDTKMQRLLGKSARFPTLYRAHENGVRGESFMNSGEESRPVFQPRLLRCALSRLSCRVANARVNKTKSCEPARCTYRISDARERRDGFRCDLRGHSYV